jgi:tetratricopeptide (TPR) repeat protein
MRAEGAAAGRPPSHRRARRVGPMAALCLALWVPDPGLAQAGPDRSLSQIEGMIQTGRLAEAEQALRSLSAAGAGARADYLLGFTLLQLYRLDEAEVALRRAVDRRPEQLAWLHALAKALQEQGKNLAAIEVLDRAIAREPRPDYLFARAMCALNVGDLAAAEADLRRCIRDSPGHTEALYSLGRILVDQGEYTASLEPLRACLERQPSHLEARFLLGLAASHTGDPEAARQAFEAVIEAVPGHVGARYNLGRVLIELGRREEGVARLEEFRSLSRLRDQIDFFRQAVKKNPRNQEGRVALSRLLLDAGRTEEALQELLAARQVAPRDTETFRLLAVAFRRLGREADAARAEGVARRLVAGR